MIEDVDLDKDRLNEIFEHTADPNLIYEETDDDDDNALSHDHHHHS